MTDNSPEDSSRFGLQTRRLPNERMKDRSPCIRANGNLLQHEANKDNFTRTLGGAFVQFESGARVGKIRLPSDFSAARIHGLPRNTSPDAVRDMLAALELHANVDNIRILRLENGCAAVVQSDEASFSKRLCALIGASYTWRDATLSATPVAAPMPSGYSGCRVDCKKIHLSWHKPSRTVWLNFGNGDIAQRVSRKFSKGTYLVLDQKVAASDAVRAETASRFHSTNPVAWTVALNDVPAVATREAILQAIREERDKPRHVEIGPPTYVTDLEQAATVVRSLLTGIGPLEYWETTLETTSRRVKAAARFLDESDAREAANKLANTALPFNRKARLTVKSVYSAKFKVGCAVYDAVHARIAAQENAWQEGNVWFKAYKSADVLKRFRVLKIEAELADKVARTKAELEEILAGVVVKDGDGVLWDTSLKANGQLYQAIKKVEKELKVIVIRDKIKSELRLYGDEGRCARAQVRLAEVLRAELQRTSARTIELGLEQFGWACRGGFKAIVSRLGADKVSFDIVSMPKKMIISGSLEDYDVAVAAITDGAEQVLDLDTQPQCSDAGEACSVCWTDADTPVRIRCGHIYCLECFQHSCDAGAVGETLGIFCHGNQGTCHSPVAIDDLRDNLSSAILERLLERSFAVYVKHHPDELRYCPTPDCGYIYKVTSKAQSQHCPKCLQTTCSACHEPHVGMSCADHREIASGNHAAFLKLKEALNIKGCPRCKTLLEKTQGCNHMTCSVCQAHICWVCMMVFREAGAVYAHMSKLHGSHVDIQQ
ncbi:ariadne RING finger, putative [Cordyceps militaris CM01]|uniref:Ariadne RING finger, putative n=1 Tax=Cordyceps militaris (strain CM01) TaxID=983644 RepID=G3JIL9_CORMM|nr:ariadne RING finger, putative [Cordyceps militaris CM01]EGX91916.1 ariadne RING finger, putative [Cordyceps militaris CM01]